MLGGHPAERARPLDPLRQRQLDTARWAVIVKIQGGKEVAANNRPEGPASANEIGASRSALSGVVETIDPDGRQVDSGGSFTKDAARRCYVNETQPELSHDCNVNEAAVRARVYEGVTRHVSGLCAATYRNLDAGALTDEVGERAAALKLSRQGVTLARSNNSEGQKESASPDGEDRAPRRTARGPPWPPDRHPHRRR